MAHLEAIQRLALGIYGADTAPHAVARITRLIAEFRSPPGVPSHRKRFTEKDTVLITYADSLQQPGEPPLQTLHRFSGRWFHDLFSTTHILPFFPYSSDDGFSVMDFHAVAPGLGNWEDVTVIGKDFDLMVDLVLNHVSAKSPWFEKFLLGKPTYTDLAITVSPETDLSGVTRPRTLPLLTPFSRPDGTTVHVWTTFSPDQVDLNWKSLDVLEKMLSVLLFYVGKGARIIRLDAIAYLWKEIGTCCIHLPETHRMVQLLRAVLDVAAPGVVIITETNVPHQENIRYVGDGTNEAQLVYNFTLPPLLLHAYLSEDARALSNWAATQVQPLGADSLFLNFTASHDGIGVRPLEGIVDDAAVDKLVKLAAAHGAGAAMKSNADGSRSPYELNITYIDAILAGRKETDPAAVSGFLGSQAVAYALPGVPATYVHSILGSRNWQEGVAETGRARTINRRKLSADDVACQLKNPGTFRSRIFNAYGKMIRVRREHTAFHPQSPMTVLDLHPAVLALIRGTDDQPVCCLTNVSGQTVYVTLPHVLRKSRLRDLFTGETVHHASGIRLGPCQTRWASVV